MNKSTSHSKRFSLSSVALFVTWAILFVGFNNANGQPLMSIKGNSFLIPNRSSITAIENNTDFGTADTCDVSITKEFTIVNTGTSDLNLTGSPLIQIVGSSKFSVTSAPSSVITAGGSSNFSITYTSTTSGSSIASIQILNNSGSPNPYAFQITANKASDIEAPIITCPSDITTTCDIGQCVAEVSFALPSFSDNCAGATIHQLSGYVSGSEFLIGTTNNTFVVVDASGNSTTCSFSVTVVDNEPPAIICPDNLTLTTYGTSATLSALPAPSISDNCSGYSYTYSPTLGTVLPIGSHTITATATDLAGNTATCSFTVNVVQLSPPTVVIAATAYCTGSAEYHAIVQNTGASESYQWFINGILVPGATTPIANLTVSQGDVITCTYSADYFGTPLSATSNSIIAYPLLWAYGGGVSVNYSSPYYSIVKTVPYNYWGNAGIATQNVLGSNENGGLSAVVANTSGNIVFGLAVNNPNESYSSINYAFYMNRNSLVIMESASPVYAHPVDLSVGDVLRVMRDGNLIKYFLNGALLRTKTVSASEVLLADFSLYTGGMTSPNFLFHNFCRVNLTAVVEASPILCNSTLDLSNVTVLPTGGHPPYTINWPSSATPTGSNTAQVSGGSYTVTVVDSDSNSQTVLLDVPYTLTSWEDLTGVTPLGNKLKKTGSAGWNSGAVSISHLPSGTDGWVEIQANATTGATEYFVFGLSATNLSSSYNTIQYAIYPYMGNITIFTSGTPVATGLYHSGDILRVAREGTFIKFYRNSTLLYQTAASPDTDTEELMLDVSMFSNNMLSPEFKASFCNSLGTTFATPNEKGNVISSKTGKVGFDVVIFPNPTKDKISVLITTNTERISKQSCHYELCDALGNKKLSKEVVELHEGFEIDLTNLPVGVYTLKVVLEGETQIEKVVKE